MSLHSLREMEHIEKIYYINLDHRLDRRDQFLNEMARFGISPEKIERVSGIYNKEFGILGCGLSHKKAIETFLASNYKTCMIFEDDFTFTLDINYAKFLLRSFFEEKIPFDLVMLAGNIFKTEPCSHPYVERVLDGQTASGFILTREFAPYLLQCLTESTQLLEDWNKKHNEKKHEYCNDIYWKKLQPVSRWYIFKPKWGIQRESYSDNEYRVTNYGV